MRRRALLAASQMTGGELPSFEFPIYIYADEWQQVGSSGSFGIAHGEFSDLKNYLIELLKRKGDNNGWDWIIDDLRSFGVDIILEGQYYITWINYVEGDYFVGFGHTQNSGLGGVITDNIVNYEFS